MNTQKSTNFLAGINELGASGGDAKGLIKAMVASAEMAVGEFTGTGAALDVALAFEPQFVIIFNLTDGDTMGFAFNTTNAGGISAVVDTLVAKSTANQGILFTAGSKKFSLGTDAKLNENLKVYQYVAFGY